MNRYQWPNRQEVLAGLGLVVLHALAYIGQQRLGAPTFNPLWGPFLILLSLGLLFWCYYNLGLWAGGWLFGWGQDLPGGAAVAVALGLIASIAILLVLGLLGLLSPTIIFALFALILLASGRHLLAVLKGLGALRSSGWDRSQVWVWLGLAASVLTLLVLFTDTVLRGEFQSDVIDAFTVYLPEITSHLKTGDLTRPYFLFQAHVFPWLYSSLLYLPVLALATVHSLPAFSLALMILAGMLVCKIAGRLVRAEAALVAPAFFFLSFFWLYHNDLGLNLLKYNHFLSIILGLLTLYFLLEFMAGGQIGAAVMGGVATGLMVAEFSLAFPPTLVWLAACLLVPGVRRRVAATPVKVLLAWGLPIIAVPLVPLAVNYVCTGLPADPIMVPFFMKWFTPRPEFWSPFFYGGQHAYPVAYAAQTQLSATVFKLCRFYAIPLAAATVALFIGGWRRQGAPVYLLVVATLLWLVFIQHYISPKTRYQFFALPLLAITSAVLLGYFFAVLKKIVRSAKLAAVCALVLLYAAGVWAQDMAPPILQLYLAADKGLWMLNDYRSHHRAVREYQDSALQKYIREHVGRTEKIIVPQIGFLNYTLGRIALNPGTLPYHVLFMTDGREMLSTLKELHITHLLLVQGKPVTGPYRPLLLEPGFASQHLQLVALAEIRRYLFNDQLYAYRQDRRHILDPKHVETVYLFKISNLPLPQTPPQAQTIEQIVAKIKMWNTYTPEMVKTLRNLRLSKDTGQRLNDFDQKWGRASNAFERIAAGK